LALHALHLLGQRVLWRRGHLIMAALPFLFILIGKHVSLPRLPPTLGPVQQPPEAQFWVVLQTGGITAGSTHFYSDYNFIHQVYAGIPQRILWDEATYSTPEALVHLMSLGARPFFVFNSDSEEHQLFRTAWTQRDLGLVELRSASGKAIVYALPARPSSPSGAMR
jgi:hypothetical protein